MTDATQYLEEDTISSNLENQQTYVALWSSPPNNQPNETNEITGDSYSPVSVSSGTWTRVQTGGPTEVENGSLIDMGKLDTASQKIVEGVVIYDGADTSTANAIFKSDETQSNNALSITVDSGDKLEFETGGITFQMD